jgi:prepilin-type N-terminal cleavage/methylation domain-containing protein
VKLKLASSDGFSLIELLVAVSIVSILVGTISTYFANQLINVARSDTITAVQANTKQAIDVMTKDIRSARTVETTNTWPDSNGPGGSPYGWTSTNTSPSTLVLSVPAQDASGNLLYVDAGHNTLQTNDVIYYIANPGSGNDILYRRTLANPVSGNVAVTTCPPPGSVSCPSDSRIVDNIASLTIAYYDTSNNVIANPAASYLLDITLSEYQIRFKRKFTATLSSQVTLRNKP